MKEKKENKYLQSLKDASVIINTVKLLNFDKSR